MSSPFYICIAGSQGSGKGTQAKLMADFLRVTHVSTGKIYRENIAQNTPLGLKVKPYLDQGQYVPDEITNKLISDLLTQERYTSGLILDGYPRTLAQAKYLDSLIPSYQVIYLRLSIKESVKRLLKRSRSDDTEILIKKRLNNYKELTKPLLGYYQSKGRLITINGESAIPEVWRDIKKVLLSYVKN